MNLGGVAAVTRCPEVTVVAPAQPSRESRRPNTIPYSQGKTVPHGLSAVDAGSLSWEPRSSGAVDAGSLSWEPRSLGAVDAGSLSWEPRSLGAVDAGSAPWDPTALGAAVPGAVLATAW